MHEFNLKERIMIVFNGIELSQKCLEIFNMIILSINDYF